MTAAHLNRILRAATKRARDLEDLMVEVLTPVLDRAADEAARAFSAQVTNHLTASLRDADLERFAAMRQDERRSLLASLALTAAAPDPQSTMVALYPRADEAAALEHAPGEPADILHVTLAFLGETDGPLEQVAEALRPVAAEHPPLVGEVGGIGAFADFGDGHPGILLPDVPGLVELRQAVVGALAAKEIDYSRDHGYTAHLTVAYTDDLTFPSRDSYGQPLHFDDLVIVRGDTERLVLPLVGGPTITAAGELPAWTPPMGDELIDLDALVAQLRTKTDPVRLAVIEATMTKALKDAGLAWDVSNPYTAKVLAQAGSQIANIAETTQVNVMRIIGRAYDEGLSIPDTAKAIRVGMREATKARAVLIARTELAGAVNGGSLASVQIVSGTTGDKYFKTWLTAGGAKHPRHADYPGLDGQTVPLDDYFDVGGSQLQFPGDPDGDPAEVCNCRCALAYTETLAGTDNSVDPDALDAELGVE